MFHMLDLVSFQPSAHVRSSQGASGASLCSGPIIVSAIFFAAAVEVSLPGAEHRAAKDTHDSVTCFTFLYFLHFFIFQCFLYFQRGMLRRCGAAFSRLTANPSFLQPPRLPNLQRQSIYQPTSCQIYSLGSPCSGCSKKDLIEEAKETLPAHLS
jgi:hypothetical protein